MADAPFHLTLHVTAGHRSAGTSPSRSALAASDPGVDEAQSPVFFPRNVELDVVGLENRRDLRRFLTCSTPAQPHHHLESSSSADQRLRGGALGQARLGGPAV